jgi:GntR family transcriptional regulator
VGPRRPPEPTRKSSCYREGQDPEGTPLPSETQLAEMYDVTRMTARQAVDVLKNEGLVRSEHGRGVFVRQRATVHRLARNRFTRQRRETGWVPTTWR